MFKKYPFFIVLISIFLTFSHCTEKVVTRQSGFFAYYTIYGEKDAITGPFADVLINIDSMKQIVFCRETGYLPFLVTKRVVTLFSSRTSYSCIDRQDASQDLMFNDRSLFISIDCCFAHTQKSSKTFLAQTVFGTNLLNSFWS